MDFYRIGKCSTRAVKDCEWREEWTRSRLGPDLGARRERGRILRDPNRALTFQTAHPWKCSRSSAHPRPRRHVPHAGFSGHHIGHKNMKNIYSIIHNIRNQSSTSTSKLLKVAIRSPSFQALSLVPANLEILFHTRTYSMVASSSSSVQVVNLPRGTKSASRG